MALQDLQRLVITEQLAAAEENKRKEAEIRRLNEQAYALRREIIQSEVKAPANLHAAQRKLFGEWVQGEYVEGEGATRTRALRDTHAAKVLRTLMYVGEAKRRDVRRDHFGGSQTDMNAATDPLLAIVMRPNPGHKPAKWVKYSGPTVVQLLTSLPLTRPADRYDSTPSFEEVFAFWESKLGDAGAQDEAETWLGVMRQIESARGGGAL